MAKLEVETFPIPFSILSGMRDGRTTTTGARLPRLLPEGPPSENDNWMSRSMVAALLLYDLSLVSLGSDRI